VGRGAGEAWGSVFEMWEENLSTFSKAESVTPNEVHCANILLLNPSSSGASGASSRAVHAHEHEVSGSFPLSLHAPLYLSDFSSIDIG
jgi:hypothetical protein